MQSEVTSIKTVRVILRKHCGFFRELNPFQLNMAFHVESSHLIFIVNEKLFSRTLMALMGRCFRNRIKSILKTD